MLEATMEIGTAIDVQDLRRCLHDFLEIGSLDFAYVGIISGGVTSMAAVRRGGEGAQTIAPENAVVTLGCLTKVALATLVARAAHEGELDLDRPIVEFLRPQHLHAAWLGNVTVRQLLNHTHGLDSAAVDSLPRCGGGRIDLKELGKRLAAADRLSPPGGVYNYSRIGAWVAAALLENIYSDRIENILQDKLFRPMGLSCASSITLPYAPGSAADLCPGEGGRLSMTLPELLKFAAFHMNQKRASSIAGIMRAKPVAMPGHAVEAGSCLGWRHYGNGWYGHAAQAKSFSTILLINPARDISLIVHADRAALLLQSALFGLLFESDPLAELGPERPSSVPAPQRYAGIYRNHALALTIATEDGQVVLQTGGAAAPRRMGLSPLAADTFAFGSDDRPGSAWIQFVSPDAAGRYAYIWNGRNVFRRADALAAE